MAFKVTDQASQHLKALLDSIKPESGQILRLVADPTGDARLTLDTEKQDDQVITHQGDAVLVVDPLISEGLAGSTLDVQETWQGIAFTLATSRPIEGHRLAPSPEETVDGSHTHA